MSRLQEEPKIHIHDELVSDCNEMSIRIKLWHDEQIARESAEEQNKIITARSHHPEPTWEEILRLIDKCRDEMNQCTKPFRVR